MPTLRPKGTKTTSGYIRKRRRFMGNRYIRKNVPNGKKPKAVSMQLYSDGNSDLNDDFRLAKQNNLGVTECVEMMDKEIKTEVFKIEVFDEEIRSEVLDDMMFKTEPPEILPELVEVSEELLTSIKHEDAEFNLG